MIVQRDIDNHRWVITYENEVIFIDFKEDIESVKLELIEKIRNNRINKILDKN